MQFFQSTLYTSFWDLNKTRILIGLVGAFGVAFLIAGIIMLAIGITRNNSANNKECEPSIPILIESIPYYLTMNFNGDYDLNNNYSNVYKEIMRELIPALNINNSYPLVSILSMSYPLNTSIITLSEIDVLNTSIFVLSSVSYTTNLSITKDSIVKSLQTQNINVLNVVRNNNTEQQNVSTQVCREVNLYIDPSIGNTSTTSTPSLTTTSAATTLSTSNCICTSPVTTPCPPPIVSTSVWSTSSINTATTNCPPCLNTTPTIPPNPWSKDVLILLDSSNDIDEFGFKQLLEFLAYKILPLWPLNDTLVNVGVAIFNTDFFNLVSFFDSNNINELQNMIIRAIYQHMIEFNPSLTSAFQKISKMRSIRNAPSVTVLLTATSNSTDIASAAPYINPESNVIVVGVGNAGTGNFSQFNSTGAMLNVFLTTNNYPPDNVATSIAQIISPGYIASVTPPITTTILPPTCDPDIAILIDNSMAVGSRLNYLYEIDFIANRLVNSWTVSPLNIEALAMIYNQQMCSLGNGSIAFRYNSSIQLQQVVQDFDDDDRLDFTPSITAGVAYLRSFLNNRRAGKNLVILLFTYSSNLSDMDTTIPELNNIQNFSLIVIGIGNVDINNLNLLPGRIFTTNYTYTDSDINQQINSAICTPVTISTSTSTTPSSTISTTISSTTPQITTSSTTFATQTPSPIYYPCTSSIVIAFDASNNFNDFIFNRYEKDFIQQNLVQSNWTNFFRIGLLGYANSSNALFKFGDFVNYESFSQGLSGIFPFNEIGTISSGISNILQSYQLSFNNLRYQNSIFFVASNDQTDITNAIQNASAVNARGSLILVALEPLANSSNLLPLVNNNKDKIIRVNASGFGNLPFDTYAQMILQQLMCDTSTTISSSSPTTSFTGTVTISNITTTIAPSTPTQSTTPPQIYNPCKSSIVVSIDASNNVPPFIYNNYEINLVQNYLVQNNWTNFERVGLLGYANSSMSLFRFGDFVNYNSFVQGISGISPFNEVGLITSGLFNILQNYQISFNNLRYQNTIFFVASNDQTDITNALHNASSLNARGSLILVAIEPLANATNLLPLVNNNANKIIRVNASGFGGSPFNTYAQMILQQFICEGSTTVTFTSTTTFGTATPTTNTVTNSSGTAITVTTSTGTASTATTSSRTATTATTSSGTATTAPTSSGTATTATTSSGTGTTATTSSGTATTVPTSSGTATTPTISSETASTATTSSGTITTATTSTGTATVTTNTQTTVFIGTGTSITTPVFTTTLPISTSSQATSPTVTPVQIPQCYSYIPVGIDVSADISNDTYNKQKQFIVSGFAQLYNPSIISVIYANGYGDGINDPIIYFAQATVSTLIFLMNNFFTHTTYQPNFLDLLSLMSNPNSLNNYANTTTINTILMLGSAPDSTTLNTTASMITTLRTYGYGNNTVIGVALNNISSTSVQPWIDAGMKFLPWNDDITNLALTLRALMNCQEQEQGSTSLLPSTPISTVSTPTPNSTISSSLATSTITNVLVPQCYSFIPLGIDVSNDINNDMYNKQIEFIIYGLSQLYNPNVVSVFYADGYGDGINDPSVYFIPMTVSGLIYFAKSFLSQTTYDTDYLNLLSLMSNVNSLNAYSNTTAINSILFLGSTPTSATLTTTSPMITTMLTYGFGNNTVIGISLNSSVTQNEIQPWINVGMKFLPWIDDLTNLTLALRTMMHCQTSPTMLSSNINQIS